VADLPQVDGVSHRQLRVRGVDFHLAEAGGGEDVVLCLHGWPQHWFEWRHLMPALAEHQRVLALDLRGFGWSEAPRSGYDKENMATDVLALLDELGLQRVKLIGHDWGGWIGFLACLRAPQRFERFLALNILPPWVSARAMAPHLWRFWYQWLILSPGIGYGLHRSAKFVPKVLVGGSTKREAWDPESLRAFGENLAEPARARAAVQMYRVFNLQEALPIIRGRYSQARLIVPTLLLFGTDDSVLRAETLAGYRRHAEDMDVELVPGCGHFIADECPDLVARRAREFLLSAN
jgi:pimeloyl-ACP methyl ester carboxylesterase